MGVFYACCKEKPKLVLDRITGSVLAKYQIPVGAAAQVAIYTQYWHHVSLLRKILLRMRSWQNYVFLEGH